MKAQSRIDRELIAFARLLEAKALREAEIHNLRVLVWGASPSAKGEDQTKLKTKRSEIRDALRSEGHQAYFSEDLVIEQGSELPLNLLEHHQAKEMDAVIILATSFGAVGELHDHALALGPKVLVWLDVRARGKYTDEGIRRSIDAAGGRSAFFHDRDLEACSMTLASVDFVNDKRYLQAQIEGNIEMLPRHAPIKR